MPVPKINIKFFSHKEINSTALETFFNICDKWGINNKEQMILLGLESKSTFFKWKKDKTGILQKDTLTRISYILGIYKALQIIFPDEQQADAWIKKSNKAFNEYSALDIMLGGNLIDIARVREYLDAQRGW